MNNEYRPNFDTFGEWYANRYNLKYIKWQRDPASAMTVFIFQSDYTFWLGITDEYLLAWGDNHASTL